MWQFPHDASTDLSLHDVGWRFRGKDLTASPAGRDNPVTPMVKIGLISAMTWRESPYETWSRLPVWQGPCSSLAKEVPQIV